MNPMSAWAFALELYERPGMAGAFLTLQDQLGVDVDVMLFALFAACERGVALDKQRLADADAVVRAWRLEVIEPLRALRRSMKSLALDEAQKEVRQMVKDAELRAEQVEIGMLEAWFGRFVEPSLPRTRQSSALSDLPLQVATFFAAQSGTDPAVMTQPAIVQALQKVQGALARP